MKRSQLTRKKQLARGTKPLKRTRLARRSPKGRDWDAKYKAQHESDPMWVMDAVSGGRFHKSIMVRHHVARRLGKRILIYVYIFPSFHRVIEDNVKGAMEAGWIRREGEGYAKDPNQPRPWVPGSCINEHLLDE